MARDDAEILGEFDSLLIFLQDAVKSPELHADKQRLAIALHQLDLLEHVLLNKPRKYDPLAKR